MAYSDEFLGYLELKQDLLFNKIPPEARKGYIIQALEIGQEAASQVATTSITRLYEQANIKIVKVEKSGQLFKTKLRAQYEEGPNHTAKVTYYKESIENLARSGGLSYDQALKIHLAHEFFHYWEMEKATPVNEQLAKVKLTKVFGWQRYGTILRTSEIAANAFAKTFLKLPFLPNLYDYQYLITTKELPADWLTQAYAAYQDEVGKN